MLYWLEIKFLMINMGRGIESAQQGSTHQIEGFYQLLSVYRNDVDQISNM